MPEYAMPDNQCHQGSEIAKVPRREICQNINKLDEKESKEKREISLISETVSFA